MRALYLLKVDDEKINKAISVSKASIDKVLKNNYDFENPMGHTAAESAQQHYGEIFLSKEFQRIGIFLKPE
ncbi:MAG: hypothetical protein M3R36_18105 [Bacteroidota bacterium]|nr:hypothetical protein [Bacteroidota bacterium]